MPSEVRGALYVADVANTGVVKGGPVTCCWCGQGVQIEGEGNGQFGEEDMDMWSKKDHWPATGVAKLSSRR